MLLITLKNAKDPSNKKKNSFELLLLEQITACFSCLSNKQDWQKKNDLYEI